MIHRFFSTQLACRTALLVSLCLAAPAGSASADVLAKKSWQPPQLVETNTSNAYTPQVAVNGSGNAISIWSQNSNIYANCYTAGGGWGAAQPIAQDESNAGALQIAIDSVGNAIAIWRQIDIGTSYSIYTNRYTAGSGWGTAQLIEQNVGNVERPNIAIDGAGNAIAIWQQQDSTKGNNIWTNYYTAGSGWGTAQLIEQNVGNASKPQIAIDGAGNAIAIWEQQDSTKGNNIWTNYYTAGSGWGTAQLIEQNVGNASKPQIAIDGTGNAIAIWEQQDGTSYSIYANHYTAGSGWGTAKLLEQNVGNASDPQIAIDGAGKNAIAIWEQQDGTSYSIYANHYTAGSGWGTAKLLEQNVGYAVLPKIAIDGAGNALVVWHQQDGTNYSIYANRYTAGSGWEKTQLIEQNVGDAMLPKIAINGAGNAIAVWQQQGNIWAAWYK